MEYERPVTLGRCYYCGAKAVDTVYAPSVQRAIFCRPVCAEHRDFALVLAAHHRTASSRSGT